MAKKKNVEINEKDIIAKRTFWLKIDFIKTKQQEWAVKRELDIKQLLPCDLAEIMIHLDSLKAELRKIYATQFTQNAEEKQSYIG